MRFLPLIWADMWRRPVRTVLTFLSIVVAFALFAILQGVSTAFGEASDTANANRLITMNKTSFTEPLPLADLSKIQGTAGVKSVTYAVWFAGYYRERSNAVIGWVVDADHFFDLYSELKVPASVVAAFKRTPDAAIAPDIVARKYDWKVGSRIPLTSIAWLSDTGSPEWNFELVGTYPSTSESGLVPLNYRYFNERRSYSNNTVGWYVVEIDDPKASADVARAIDAHFANSPDETETVTTSAFTQSFLRQYVDISFVVSSVMGSVFFTLLFLTWNTISQSVRERFPEFAVLKTFGFTDSTVVRLVVVETVLLCGVAACLGIILAAFNFSSLLSSFGLSNLSPVVYAEGCVAALLLALASALPPAIRAQRLRIVDALSSYQ